MALKRMFSKQIIDSDAFLDMPMSSQLLYFHFVMNADDEGFLGNPKKVMRLVGVGEDDFKVLIAKRFILKFDSGVIVIKHWLIHNTIRMDRFQKTSYGEEKLLLSVKENKAYTENPTLGLPNGNQMATQVKLSKDKISKDSTSDKSEVVKPKFTSLGADILKAFEEINPSCKFYYNRPPQRQACDDLIKEYGFEKVASVIKNTLPKSNGIPYFPTITTPVQLRDKWSTLESAIIKKRSENNSKGRGFV